MKIYHCSNPEENPLPYWMKKSEKQPEAAKTNNQPKSSKSHSAVFTKYPHNASYPFAEYIKSKREF